MADAEQVLAFLDPPDDVEIIGIVVNSKGAARAVETEAVARWGFRIPSLLSFSVAIRTRPRRIAGALEGCRSGGFSGRSRSHAYISMAFGNPYGDPWSVDEVVAACDLLTDSGITQISLADTVGLSTPQQVADVVSAALGAIDTRSRSVFICMRALTMLRQKLRQPGMPVAGASTWPSADSAVVRLLRTRSSAMLLRNWRSPNWGGWGRVAPAAPTRQLACRSRGDRTQVRPGRSVTLPFQGPALPGTLEAMIPTLEWTSEGVRFLDQTRLPLEEVYVLATTYQQVARSLPPWRARSSGDWRVGGDGACARRKKQSSHHRSGAGS